MKINDTASVDVSDMREPYIGMPIYVDQRDHERYYRREHEHYRVGPRSPVGDILEDLLEGELLEDIIRHEEVVEEAAIDEVAAGAKEMTAGAKEMTAGAATEIVEEESIGIVGEIIIEDATDNNIEAYCKDSIFEAWPVAMAYVPWQNFTEVYEPEKALRAGTIFPELNLPFLGGGRK